MIPALGRSGPRLPLQGRSGPRLPLQGRSGPRLPLQGRSGPPECGDPVSLSDSAATVVLETDRCDCTLVAVGVALPGVRLGWLGDRAEAEGVGGWVLTNVDSEQSELIEDNRVLALDVTYTVIATHTATGIEAYTDIEVGSDQHARVGNQWFEGCQP